tara:strand:+ start:255 stop:1205 length:951 start_codon:yes stop_codon:yes gene_type:complete
MKKKLRIDCERLRTGFSWVRGSTGHRTLRVRGDDGLPLYGKRETPDEPLRTLLLLLGGLRGGEAAWSSLYRNLIEPNGPHIDTALVLGIKPSRLAWARKTSLVHRATYSLFTRDVADWGSHLDELANSTIWRKTLAAQHVKGELGVHGHSAFGGVLLSRCRSCQSSCRSRTEPWLAHGYGPICKRCRRECIGGTGVINYVMRWRACAPKLEQTTPMTPETGWPLSHPRITFASRRLKIMELGLSDRYARLVVTRTDMFYACRLDLLSLGGLVTDEDERSGLRVDIPRGEDWYGVYDRFAVCSGCVLRTSCCANVQR